MNFFSVVTRVTLREVRQAHPPRRAKGAARRAAIRGGNLPANHSAMLISVAFVLRIESVAYSARSNPSSSTQCPRLRAYCRIPK